MYIYALQTNLYGVGIDVNIEISTKVNIIHLLRVCIATLTVTFFFKNHKKQNYINLTY